MQIPRVGFSGHHPSIRYRNWRRTISWGQSSLAISAWRWNLEISQPWAAWQLRQNQHYGSPTVSQWSLESRWPRISRVSTESGFYIASPSLVINNPSKFLSTYARLIPCSQYQTLAYLVRRISTKYALLAFLCVFMPIFGSVKSPSHLEILDLKRLASYWAADIESLTESSTAHVFKEPKETEVCRKQ